MLPSELLVKKIYKGKIIPKFVPLNEEYIEMAEEIIHIFERFVGIRQGDLPLDELEEGYDYRLIRGLIILLERRCFFEVQCTVDPVNARRAVFEEAKGPVTSNERRGMVLRDVASTLGVSIDELEQSLWADSESELILKEFNSLSPEELLRSYNLSLAQTLLFKAMGMEIYVGSNYQNIFRSIKHLGLMYLVEKHEDGFCIIVEGPMSLMKTTERYGTAIAKLLPTIIGSEKWMIKASIVHRYGNKPRILEFTMDGDSYGDALASGYSSEGFDSTIERKFSQGFNSLDTGWFLRREPEPLFAGRSVFIPDFSFEKRVMKVYLEIVGFWTEDYLRRKIAKLQSIDEENMIIAVDKNLSCSSSSFRDIKGKVIFYEKKVPLKPILDYLREHEEKNIRRDVESLAKIDLELRGDLIELDKMASERDVSIEAIKRVVSEARKEYVLVGGQLVSRSLIEKLKVELKDKNTRIEAAKLLEGRGITRVDQMLDLLGYDVMWVGLDPENAMIVRKVDQSIRNKK
jgi:predicted nuclease of restriction endonuclease-like RecB superfamily